MAKLNPNGMVHEDEQSTYRIVRFYVRKPKEVLAEGLTLAEVRAHCSSPETASMTAQSPEARARTAAHGAWFEGYEVE